MGTRAVRKKEASGYSLEELKDELRQALNELPLVGGRQDAGGIPAGLDFREAVAEYERNLIVAALRVAEGQKKRAARLLRMSPSTLHGKIIALGIS